MSSLIADAAEKAINSSNPLLNKPNVSTGKLKDKDVTHWSYKVFIVGSIVGLVAAAAAVAMQATALAIISCLFCLTNALAAYFIKKLSGLKTLEGYTNILTERVQKLASMILDLKKVNEQLDKVCYGISKIPEDWQIVIKEGFEKLKEKTAALDVVTNKLNLAQTRLEKFAQVTENLQQQTEKMSQSVLDFTKENNFLGEEVEKINEHVKTLNKEDESLASQVTKLDLENDQTRKIIETYAKQNQLLDNIFNAMKKMNEEANKRTEGLKQEVKNLGIYIPKVEESANNVASLAEKLRALNQRLESKIQKLNLLKKDPLYNEFLEWEKERNQGGIHAK